MKVLVTGGAGFIGSFLVDRLVEDGHDVRIFDNLDPQVHPAGEKPDYFNTSAEFIKGDVRDVDCLRRALKGIEVIFHEASAVGMGQSQYMIKHYVDVNTGGTANLLDLLANEKHDVQKLVVAASQSSYGEGCYRRADGQIVQPGLRSEEQLKRREWEHLDEAGNPFVPVPTPETARHQCWAVYALTKRDQEDLVLAIGQAYTIPVTALRYFNVYGPRQSLSNPYTGVMAIFMSRLANGNPPVIYEDGLQSRDFISVHDVVEANILAMEKEEADYQVFNLGTGKPTTILDVANGLADIYGIDIEAEVTHKFRKGDTRHCYANIDLIRSKLGFEPRVSLQEGLKELVEWSRGVKAEDHFEKAAKELAAKGLA